MHATGESISPSLGQFTIPAPVNRIWIYLSRIARDVTPEQINELAKVRLSTEDVVVVRLVAMNKDVNSMSFISYKVGVSADLKAKALSSSTWPKGMLFREFVDNRRNENFWKPTELSQRNSPKSTLRSHQSPMVE